MGGPPVEVCPSLLGATGWQPKVYNPKTGYLYIPSNEFCMRYAYVADLTYRRLEPYTDVPGQHLPKPDHVRGLPPLLPEPKPEAGAGWLPPPPPRHPPCHR